VKKPSDAPKRRELLGWSAATCLMACAAPAVSTPARASDAAGSNPLTPPAQGSIPVAYLISEGAVVIDFCGPWEVFRAPSMAGRKEALFVNYTVAETTKPIRCGGLHVIPDFTYETAPLPKVLVIPAQSANSQATLDWIRKVAATADVTMSVCNGAYLLAQTGLLSGKAATLHHSAFVDFAMQYPEVQVKRGARFVEAGNLACSGGLSSGMDLAFRVIERYYGRDVATRAAFAMEYQGEGWMNPGSNSIYARPFVSTKKHPICVVCGMDVERSSALKSVLAGEAFYFCSETHKKAFDAAPQKFVTAVR